MFPLIPLVLPGIASLGKGTMDAWHHVTQGKDSTAQAPNGVNFDDLLKQMGQTTAASSSTQPALTPKELHALTHQLMHSPELKAALAGGKSPEDIGLQIAPDGTVSVAAAGGGRQDLILSPNTQALAQQVGFARGG